MIALSKIQNEGVTFVAERKIFVDIRTSFTTWYVYCEVASKPLFSHIHNLNKRKPVWKQIYRIMKWTVETDKIWGERFRQYLYNVEN